MIRQCRLHKRKTFKKRTSTIAKYTVVHSRICDFNKLVYHYSCLSYLPSVFIIPGNTY